MNLEYLNQEDIIKGNKIIAEFMGGIVVEKTPIYEVYDMGKNRFQNQTFWNAKSLKYHKSMDWLIPVIEEIEHTFVIGTKNGSQYKVCIDGYQCEIYFNNTILFMENKAPKVLSTWSCIVQFIEYYNSFKKL